MAGLGWAPGAGGLREQPHTLLVCVPFGALLQGSLRASFMVSMFLFKNLTH